MLEFLRYTIDTNMVNRNFATKDTLSSYRDGFAGQIAAEMQRLANITTPGVDISLKNNWTTLKKRDYYRDYYMVTYQYNTDIKC